MKLIKVISFGLVISFLIPVVGIQAATQTVVPTPSSKINAAAGQSIEFSLKYTADSEDLEGIGVGMYFDSRKLTFVEVTSPFEEGLLGLDKDPKSDKKNIDNDTNTDQSVTAAWSDLGKGQWPGVGKTPLDLYTVRFTTAADFSGETTINLVGKGSGSNPQMKSITVANAADSSSNLESTNGQEGTSQQSNGGGSMSWFFMLALPVIAALRRRFYA